MVTPVEAMRTMSEIGLFGVVTVVIQGLLAMSLVVEFLSPVTVVETQFVTVVMKGLLTKSSAGELAMEGLLWVRLEEDRGRGNSSECSRILLFVTAVGV